MTGKKAPIAAKKSDRVREDFVREVDGVEIRLPSMAYLKPGIIRRIRNLGNVNAMYTLMETVLDDKALAVLDDMDPEEYDALLDDWRAHSGVSLGES
jgi:hypothetical protein